jgi:hypothetical protein
MGSRRVPTPIDFAALYIERFANKEPAAAKKPRIKRRVLKPVLHNLCDFRIINIMKCPLFYGQVSYTIIKHAFY